jgi:beta-lactamase superfamily II metal-dependent hydrolase
MLPLTADCRLRLTSVISKKYLKIYNMGHGDCYFLHDKSCGMLIDCGGNTAKQYRQYVLTALNKDIASISQSAKSSFVVSHFHQDHMNQLQNITNIVFSDVYAPNFMSAIDIDDFLTTLIIKSNTSKAYHIAMNYLLFIPRILTYMRPCSIIHFVSKGRRIKNNFGNFDVLWPDKGNYFSILSKNKIKSDDQLSELISKVKELFVWVNKHIENNDEADLTYEHAMEMGPKIEEAIRDLIKYIESRKGNERLEETRKINNLVNVKMNSISLVIYEPANKALFTGDIDKVNYERHISSHIAGPICYLKAPHHGSKQYFSIKLPTSMHVFINEKIHSKHIAWQYNNKKQFENIYLFADSSNTKYLNVKTVYIRRRFPWI